MWTLVVLCLALLGVGWTFHSYGRFGEQLSSLAGMTLGDTRAEVKYKLGVPQMVSATGEAGEPGARAYYTKPGSSPANPGSDPASSGSDSANPGSDSANALPEGADIDSYSTWSYNNGSASGPHIDLIFDASGRVSKITCIDQSDPPTVYCGRLVGIGVGDSEGHVDALLGTPSRQFIDERRGVKTMDYADIGATFFLAKERIYGVSIAGTGVRKQPPPDRFVPWYTSDLKAALRP